jgi:hypothetical protein
MIFGVRSALVDACDTHPAELGRWLVGSAVVHDLVLLPAVAALAWVLRRLVPAAAWPAVRAGALVAGAFLLAGWPYVAGYGASPGNPSLLPRDYRLGALVTVSAIVAVTAVAATMAVVRRRRVSR